MNDTGETNMSDNDRLREIARILASGILRLRSRAALSIEPRYDTNKSLKSGQDCLEVSAEAVLSVHLG